MKWKMLTIVNTLLLLFVIVFLTYVSYEVIATVNIITGNVGPTSTPFWAPRTMDASPTPWPTSRPLPTSTIEPPMPTPGG